jgi:hypothetical protein
VEEPTRTGGEPETVAGEEGQVTEITASLTTSSMMKCITVNAGFTTRQAVR